MNQPLNARAAGGLLAALLLGCWPGALAAPATPPLPPLTTVPGSPRLPGKFVWADLVTDDVPAAQKFYSQMFGWKFWNYGGYLVALNDQRPLAGMFQQPRPKDKPAEPRWFGYLSVASVDRATRAATNAGARVLSPARPMPKRGEQALLADPEGALFGVIKSSAGDPPDFQADPGDWIWIQMISRDAVKAAEFYRAVGGYQVVENTTPKRLSDYVLTSGGFARATVRTIGPNQEKVRPTWLPFVRVQNVGEAVALAQKLGGKVLVAPKPENLEGKVAVIADPTGAAIGIMEWPEGLTKGGK